MWVDMRVEELVERHAVYAAGYYRCRDSRPTGEARVIAAACRPFVDALRGRDVDSLRCADARLVQEAMIARGWCRRTCNDYMRRVRSVLRWGATFDLVDAGVWVRFRSLPHLRVGRTQARESPGRVAVGWADVEGTLAEMPRGAAAAVRLQWWTGCRPGEALAMRVEQLRRCSGGYVYSPPQHKTRHYGHARNIVLGPRAVADLPALPRHGLVFLNGRGGAYTGGAYRRTITRAAARAGVAHWCPHQLRHSAATRFAAKVGVEAARVLLGHRTVAATELYVEREITAAVDAARRVA